MANDKEVKIIDLRPDKERVLSFVEAFLSHVAGQCQRGELYRKANKKEKKIIAETFGGADYIEYILGDIIELYPTVHMVRRSMDDGGNYQVIGCCGQSQHYYYCLRDEKIYLIHNFSTFPA